MQTSASAVRRPGQRRDGPVPVPAGPGPGPELVRDRDRISPRRGLREPEFATPARWAERL
jgi:hypothetical protein